VSGSLPPEHAETDRPVEEAAEQPNKCGHASCACRVRDDQALRFCSAYCAQMEEEGAGGHCRCGHEECEGKG